MGKSEALVLSIVRGDLEIGGSLPEPFQAEAAMALQVSETGGGVVRVFCVKTEHFVAPVTWL